MKASIQPNNIRAETQTLLICLSQFLSSRCMVRTTKFVSLILAITFSFTLLGDEITIPNQDFQEGFKYWATDEVAKAKDFGFVVETVDNERCLVAIDVSDSEKQKARGMRQIFKVPKNKISNKYLTFSADIKCIRNSGVLRLAIREVDRDGIKTIRFNNLDIKKWAPKEWKNFSKRIHIGTTTERIDIYITTLYLKPGDRILLKKLRFDIN